LPTALDFGWAEDPVAPDGGGAAYFPMPLGEYGAPPSPASPLLCPVPGGWGSPPGWGGGARWCVGSPLPPLQPISQEPGRCLFFPTLGSPTGLPLMSLFTERQLVAFFLCHRLDPPLLPLGSLRSAPEGTTLTLAELTDKPGWELGFPDGVGRRPPEVF